MIERASNLIFDSLDDFYHRVERIFKICNLHVTATMMSGQDIPNIGYLPA